MKIEIFGVGCKKCRVLEANSEGAAPLRTFTKRNPQRGIQYFCEAGLRREEKARPCVSPPSEASHDDPAPLAILHLAACPRCPAPV